MQEMGKRRPVGGSVGWYKEEASFCDVCGSKCTHREEEKNGVRQIKPSEYKIIDDNGISYCEFCYSISREQRVEFAKDRTKLIEQHLEKIRELEAFA